MSSPAEHYNNDDGSSCDFDDYNTCRTDNHYRPVTYNHNNLAPGYYNYGPRDDHNDGSTNSDDSSGRDVDDNHNVNSCPTRDDFYNSTEYYHYVNNATFPSIRAAHDFYHDARRSSGD